jgi:hypothetical protein
MELVLRRTYEPQGVNGELLLQFCKTIELPWLSNARNISCIPEGRYELKKRYTKLRGDHLIVCGVPGRGGILIHPANHALKQLQGCIAPVNRHTGTGKGIGSRLATESLTELVFSAFDQDQKVFLTINS